MQEHRDDRPKITLPHPVFRDQPKPKRRLKLRHIPWDDHDRDKRRKAREARQKNNDPLCQQSKGASPIR